MTKYTDTSGKFKSFKQYPYQGYWTDPRPITMKKNTYFSDKLKAKATSQRSGKVKKTAVPSDGIRKPKYKAQAKISRSKSRKTSAGDVSGIVDFLRTKDLKKLKNRKY